ncbi:MAG: T9SS type A sorting domain-containing protein [Ignavibacteriaceae bacterium]
MNYNNTFLVRVFVFALFSSFSFAQITIDPEDFDFMFERETNIYTYMDSSTTTIDIGTTGESSWDFSSGLSIDKSFTFDVISPGGTPYRPDYPNAHVAFKYHLNDSIDMESWEYYCRSANLVHLHGLVDASQTVPDQVTKYLYDPIKLFAYVPMTFNTTWRDSVIETLVTEAKGVVRGEREYTVVTNSMVDAYGTIIFPDSSSAEALRVKIVESRTRDNMTEDRVFFRWFAKTGETLVVETDPSSPDSGMIPVKNVKWTLKSEITTNVPVETATLPMAYQLSQNYPNPFNPSTQIMYTVPEDAYVQLRVYNTIGKEVAALVNDRKSAGTYVAAFNGENLSSGIYFVKMTAGKFNQVIKMTLVK